MGDGSEAFDFVAVEDCAYANICAMKSDALDRNCNVGGVRTSLKELAEKLLKITGSNKSLSMFLEVRQLLSKIELEIQNWQHNI